MVVEAVLKMTMFQTIDANQQYVGGYILMHCTCLINVRKFWSFFFIHSDIQKNQPTLDYCTSEMDAYFIFLS